MIDSSLAQLAAFDTERSVTDFTGPLAGVYQPLGSAFTHNPLIMVLDNQSTFSVSVSFDGVNTWKTFAAGEALVLDFKANAGMAGNFVVNIGTQVYVKGTGTGFFGLSIIYAR